MIHGNAAAVGSSVFTYKVDVRLRRYDSVRRAQISGVRACPDVLLSSGAQKEGGVLWVQDDAETVREVDTRTQVMVLDGPMEEARMGERVDSTYGWDRRVGRRWCAGGVGAVCPNKRTVEAESAHRRQPCARRRLQVATHRVRQAGMMRSAGNVIDDKH
jgi:hypothetical protein